MYDEPGVTRDRTYGKGFWGAHEFSVIDTGGLVFDDDPNQVFMPHIRQQALAALTEAQVALLVVDGKDGCSPLDEDIAAFLRKQGVPTVLAVNKCESTTQGEVQAADFWGLGLGEPWAVSGLHGTGMGEVMDELVKHLPPAGPIAEEEEAETDLRVAILGRRGCRGDERRRHSQPRAFNPSNANPGGAPRARSGPSSATPRAISTAGPPERPVLARRVDVDPRRAPRSRTHSAWWKFAARRGSRAPWLRKFESPSA